ncbi:tetratricopeptide repeat (TPR)-containing protein [Artemisia annua]|uniref:Tetratricopeptide repeat (TPR)-containing protein n=1 Tax=Artemisia annua TaxID=35608 RepID=A0A2U1LTE1_ARTAN|nr:tetratricopeptide repeat (TPR)-containing protein [Artemisia annua]
MQGGIALASLVKNERCFLKVVDLSKCRLGLVGIVSILEALRVNVFIEKLNLSENALHEYNASLEFVDEIGAEKPRVYDPKGNCILQLSSAIANAIHLRLLDVSNNGFSVEVGERLFEAWSMRSRCGVTQSHIEGNIVHLSVEPKQCCKLKPLCCTRFTVL